MYADGWHEPVATIEVMDLYVDSAPRRVSESPVSALDRMVPVNAHHGRMVRPRQAGRVIGIRGKRRD